MEERVVTSLDDGLAGRSWPRGLDLSIPGGLRGYCLVQLLTVAAATVHVAALHARLHWRLGVLEALGVVAATFAALGLLAGRREFLVLEALRLAATGFVLVALWTHGSFGPSEPLLLAALLAPIGASAVAMPFVAGRWFSDG